MATTRPTVDQLLAMTPVERRAAIPPAALVTDLDDLSPEDRVVVDTLVARARTALASGTAMDARVVTEEGPTTWWRRLARLSRQVTGRVRRQPRPSGSVL